MTDAESLLWKVLRGRNLFGYKFQRQYVILYQGNLRRYNYFIVDFYCAEVKLIIEVDGPIHDNNKEYDSYRDLELEYLGYKVLRFKNSDLGNIEWVKQQISQLLIKSDK